MGVDADHGLRTSVRSGILKECENIGLVLIRGNIHRTCPDCSAGRTNFAPQMGGIGAGMSSLFAPTREGMTIASAYAQAREQYSTESDGFDAGQMKGS